MTVYAVIDNGQVVNVVVCDDDTYATAQGWVKLKKGAGIGWSYDGTTWSPPKATS